MMTKIKIVLVISLLLLLQGCYTTFLGGKAQDKDFFNMEPEHVKIIKRHYGFYGFISYDSKTASVIDMCGATPKNFGTMKSAVDIIIDVVGGIFTFGLLPLFYSQTTVFAQC